jgi:quinol monooxygenase YgiN
MYSSRKSFIGKQLALLTVAVITSSVWPAQAAMQNSQNTFQAGKDLTLDQALNRFQEAQGSLHYLLDNYDEICQGGGDNVRRYLGTVGVSSGLYGISKVLKILKDQADVDDIVAFSELSDELMAAINQADGSAYMAIFTTTSTSGVPSEKYYNDAKTEIKNATRAMQALQKQLPQIK